MIERRPKYDWASIEDLKRCDNCRVRIEKPAVCNAAILCAECFGKELDRCVDKLEANIKRELEQ